MRTKRILALMLALAMLVSVMPLTVLAADRTAEAAVGEGSRQAAESLPREAIAAAQPEWIEAPEDGAPVELPALSEDETSPAPLPASSQGELLAALKGDQAEAPVFELVMSPAENRLAALPPEAFGLCPGDTQTASSPDVAGDQQPFEGNGDLGSPYLIQTVADLVTLAQYVNNGCSYPTTFFKLTADLDLSSVCGEQLGDWVPIGRSVDITFKGIFDGNNKTISGLYFNSEDNNLGLFGNLTGNVSNLNLNVSINGGSRVGGLAGICHGYVNNCTVSGTVSGGSYVGGLIGLCGPGCNVRDCSSSATVTGVGAAIGGVFGAANNIFTQEDREELGEDGACLGQASLSYCVFTGTVTGTNSSSAAYTTYNEEAGTITLHYKDNATGGIVGWCNAFGVSQCRNEGTVNGFDFTGGVVGDCSNDGSVYKCTNYGTVNGGTYLTGGVAGRVGSSKINSCENHGAVSGWWFTGGVAGFVDKESYIDNSAVGTYCSNMGDVTGTRFTGGVIGISNKRIWGYCTNSATVTGEEYTGGIAGYTTRALSSCDNLAEGVVIGETCTGGVVGCTVNRIYSCKNIGTVTGTVEKTGGVAGWSRYTVYDCCNDYTGQVAGVKYTGGVSGRGDGAAENCENKGAVSGSDSFTGGVLGGATAPVTNCKNTGTVSGTVCTGGVVGSGTEGCSVSACKNQGTVTGSNNVAGVIGLNQGSVVNCENASSVTGENVTGGVVAEAGAPVSNCSNSGSVKGRGACTGGVVGMTIADVADCFNTGTVVTEGTATGYTGGVVGISAQGEGSDTVPSVSNCRNEGSVSGLVQIGGVAGYAAGRVSNCENKSSGSVTGSVSSSAIIGGVTAYAGGETVSCQNYGTVSGGQYVGGVLGDTGESASLNNCRNVGQVTGTDKRVGGVVGNLKGAAANCENSGTVTGGTENTGGVAGFAGSTSSLTLCTNTGAVSGQNDVGGVAGYCYGTLTGCTNHIVGQDKIQGSSTVGGVAGVAIGTVRSCVNEGTVEGGTIAGGVCGALNAEMYDCVNKAYVSGGTKIGGVVGACVDLEEFASSAVSSVTNSRNEGEVRATGEDLGGVIGLLSSGLASGCGNTGTVAGSSGHVGGIVGRSYSGTVLFNCHNLGGVSGGQATGGVAGWNSGFLTGCDNQSNITGNSNLTGGVAGYDDGSGISICRNSGSVTGKKYTGGIAGQTSSLVQSCRNTGPVSSSTGIVGGIAGVSKNQLKDCFNTSSVTGSYYVGGVAGQTAGLVTGCYNDATAVVTASGASAGVTAAGGVVGYQDSGTVEYCCNKGKVRGGSGGTSTGGVVGYTENTVRYCYSDIQSDVRGKEDVGGVVGTQPYGNLISYCINAGAVGSGTSNTSEQYVGGVIGTGKNVSNCLNQGTVRGYSDVGGIMGYCLGGGEVKLCRNQGDILCGRDEYYYMCIGGVVGRLEWGCSVRQCWNEGSVTSVGHGPAGIAGYCNGGNMIENCYNLGDIKSTELGDAGGIVGDFSGDGCTMQHCYNYNGTISVVFGWKKGKLAGAYGSSEPTITECYYTNGEFNPLGWETYQLEGHYQYLTNNQMRDPAKFVGFDFTTIWYQNNGDPHPKLIGDSDFYNPLSNNSEDLDISNAQQLKDFRDQVNNGKTFEGSTVRLTADIDLGGEAWTPIASGSNQYTYNRFLGSFDGQGHTISGLNVNGDYQFAGLFGLVESPAVIRDLLVVGSVTNTRAATGISVSGTGGLAGTSGSTQYGKGAAIERCAFIGPVVGYGAVGGLVGQNNGSLTDCYHSGAVTGWAAGGVVGANLAADEFSHYQSGSNITEPIRNCYQLGGAVTGNFSAYNFVGGVVGPTKLIYIIRSGEVFMYTGFSNTRFEQSAASYGLGAYRYTTNASDSVSYDDLMTSNCSTSSLSVIPGFTALSTEQFRSASNFSGWDFNTVWGMGVDSPRLRSLSACVNIRKNDNGSCATGSMPESLWLSRSGERVYSAFSPKSGYVFGGWNTAADGSGQGYADGATIVPEADPVMTLYAQWIKATAYNRTPTVTYVTPGREGSSSESYLKLLDRNENSQWTVTGLSAGESLSVEFYTPEAIRPAAFALTTGSGAGDDPNRNPSAWILEGKVHQGDEWIVLARSDSRTAALPDLARKTCWYPVSYSGTEFLSYFRVTFTSERGGVFQLSELGLLTANPGSDVTLPVTLYPNGGTGSPRSLSLENGEEIAADTWGFSCSGKFLAGWSTEPDGSGQYYVRGAKLKAEGMTALYAQWMSGVNYQDYIPIAASHPGNGGEGYAKLLDGDDSSKWCVSNLASDAEWYVEFYTREYVKPCGYHLVTGADTGTYPGRNPTSWKLEAMNEYGEWVLLDEVAQDNRLPGANSLTAYYEISNSAEYYHYRLSFRGLVSGKTFQLGEFRLMLKDYNNDRRPARISFQPNGGTGSMSYQTCNIQQSVTLKANSYSFEGFDFAGWNTRRDGSGTAYSDKASFTVNDGDVTLYAQWSPRTYTITFVDETDQILDTQQVEAGTLPVYQGPGPLSKEGGDGYYYVFDGWTPDVVPVTGAATYHIKFKRVDIQPTPEAVFTATGPDCGTLSNVTAGMRWRIDDGEWQTVTEVPVELSGIGPCTIRVMLPGNGDTTADSAEQAIEVTKAQSPSLTPKQPGVNDTWGSIPTTAIHEFSADGENWSACAGATEDLLPGTYYVREAAHDTVLASEPQVIVLDPISGVTVYIVGNTGGSVYDGELHSVSGYSFTSSCPLYTEDDFSFTGLAQAERTNVGVTGMNLTEDMFTNDNSNFTVSFQVTDGSVTISRKGVTVKADDLVKTVNEDDPPLTATVTGLVEGEPLSLISYNLVREEGEEIGVYPITASGEEEQGNYLVSFEPGSLTIRPLCTDGHTLTYIPEILPNCTESGNHAYYHCSVCGKDFSDENAETEIGEEDWFVPALGHIWGEAEYVWEEDFSSVTATAHCTRDPDHELTETVTPDFYIVTPSTFDTTGAGYYLAEFEDEHFEAQRMDVEIPVVACEGGDACPSKDFTDMPPVTNYAHIPIDWAVVNHITLGTSPTTFGPNLTVTRAQVVTFLWGAFGKPEPTLTENPFEDVKEEKYYYKAVLWAVENGITSGAREGTFSPKNVCTRSQVVTFLWTAMNKPEPTLTENPFTDVKPTSYYYKAVLWAVENGITSGTGEGTFSPKGNCTRAQVVTFLYKLLGQ